MILSLEALQANQGDSLILYYGDPKKPSIMIIDGGPSGIYNGSLKPRLVDLKAQLSPDDPLPIALMMVSHADDDHIHGILDLTDDLISQDSGPEGPYLKIEGLWFNAFDDIIGNNEVIKAAQAAPANFKKDGEVTALIASTGQGRTIRDKAHKLGWTVNSPFSPLPGSNAVLVRGDAGSSVVPYGQLKLTVLHPNTQRLTELQDKWDKDLKALQAGDKTIVAAAFHQGADKSPFNLSSIVCLATLGDKSILLTGDGRCDDILDGLKTNKLLDKDDKIHVDILKMPHHGSVRNLTDEFLQKVTADHYVISANGKDDNPDQATLDKMRKNIHHQAILHITNNTNSKVKNVPPMQPKLQDFEAALKSAKSPLSVSYRVAAKNSFVLDLLDPLKF